MRKLGGILACYVQVMLLALQAGGVGLNLTSANHVVLPRPSQTQRGDVVEETAPKRVAMVMEYIVYC